VKEKEKSGTYNSPKKKKFQ